MQHKVIYLFYYILFRLNKRFCVCKPQNNSHIFIIYLHLGNHDAAHL